MNDLFLLAFDGYLLAECIFAHLRATAIKIHFVPVL